MKRLETNIQIAVITWFRLQYPEIAPLLFHVPNGGSRNAIEAANLKRQGVTAGVADLLLLVPKKVFGCLAIELKTDKGKLTEHQENWGAAMIKNNNAYAVCRSFDDAKTVITAYLN